MSIRDSDFAPLRGRFIVLDGPDGAGKTTVRQMVAEQLRAACLEVTECKDPGGTEIGDRIRSVLLDFDLTRMDVHCETLLFMASRAQLVKECIGPALETGHVVLCDRFVSSTCAYQVAAGHRLQSILDLARYAIGRTWPDLTLILDVPVEIGFERIARRIAERQPGQVSKPSAAHDSMERRPVAFHEAVRQNFLQLAGQYPAPVEIMNATAALPEVVGEVLERLGRFARSAAAHRSELPV